MDELEKHMSDSVERVSLTISGDLMEEVDEVVDDLEYASRSKAFRDAIRMFLSDLQWKNDLESVHRGSITTIYSHDSQNVNDELLNIQHNAEKNIIATQHIHFDSHLCLETIVVNGTGKEIRDLVNNLKSLSGMKHVQFTKV